MYALSARFISLAIHADDIKHVTKPILKAKQLSCKLTNIKEEQRQQQLTNERQSLQNLIVCSLLNVK